VLDDRAFVVDAFEDGGVQLPAALGEDAVDPFGEEVLAAEAAESRT
jgi:hypothetical protein